MKLLIWNTILGIMFVYGGSYQQHSTKIDSEKEPSDLYLFLLIGQSNMAGRGTIDAVDTTVHPHLFMLNQDNAWVPAQEPLHFDKPKVVGVGPGLAFGKSMSKAFPNVTIGLIPCAVGGSSIDKWQPGGFHDQTQSYPYDDMLRRTHAALKSGTLKGIIWHQGESDSKEVSYMEYENSLIELITRLREEFENQRLPFVVGELGNFYVEKNPYADSINSVLTELPRKVEHTAFVSAKGLTDLGDQTHFNSESARLLGERFANAMIQLMNSEK